MLRAALFGGRSEIFPLDIRAVEHPSLVAGPVFKTGEVRREAFLASSIPVLYRQLFAHFVQNVSKIFEAPNGSSRSTSDTMLKRSNTSRMRWPLIFMTTDSGTPARRALVTKDYFVPHPCQLLNREL